MGTVWRLDRGRRGREPKPFPLPDRAMWALVAMAESQESREDGGFLMRDDGRMAVLVQGGEVLWEVRGDDLDLLMANEWVVVEGVPGVSDRIDVTDQGWHWVKRFVAARGRPVWVAEREVAG